MDFVGGDKEKHLCKDLVSDEVDAYRAALAELVKAVSVAHSLGKNPGDF